MRSQPHGVIDTNRKNCRSEMAEIFSSIKEKIKNMLVFLKSLL
jgi:hypothetical protein